jgi:ectoine hydroxylase-related dioxygenase (phytanoyl-CoA dioxygenase family)
MTRYSFHERFADLALQLSGADGIRFFHDHALYKDPGDSKPTPWHQDYPFWPMENGKESLSIWIALDDVDESNGCMMFVPGSHKTGKLSAIPLNNPTNLFDYVEDEELKSRKPVMCPMKAGSCTFHNGLTFHYAHANRTAQPRRAFAIIYMPDGTIFNGKKHLVTDGSGFSEGDTLKGGLFPLLAERG